MVKVYLLYSDGTEKKLLAMAKSPEEMESKSKWYSFGQWFSYDSEGKFIFGDTEKKVKFKFPENPEKKVIINNRAHDWSGRSL